MEPTASRTVRADHDATKPPVTATVSNPRANIVCWCTVAASANANAPDAAARPTTRDRRGRTSATNGPTHAVPNATNQTFSAGRPNRATSSVVDPKSPMDRGIRRRVRVLLGVLGRDRHDLTRHVRRVVAREEHDDIGDFPRLGRAAERLARHELVQR